MGRVMVAGGKPDMAAPVSGILASELAVGSVVKLMEGGVATEYMVVNQGKPSGSSLYDDSCDGTWLLRKDIKENRQWHNTSAVNFNDYENSDIHAYLNGDFFNIFGSIEQAAIKQVKLPYRAGSGINTTITSGTNGLSAKIFLLSGYEVGLTSSIDPAIPPDGAKLDYFISGIDSDTAKAQRIAKLNGSASIWFLRSPECYDFFGDWYVLRVNVLGGYDGGYSYYSNGIRPALVIPATALFDTNTLILKGVA